MHELDEGRSQVCKQYLTVMCLVPGWGYELILQWDVLTVIGNVSESFRLGLRRSEIICLRVLEARRSEGGGRLQAISLVSGANDELRSCPWQLRTRWWRTVCENPLILKWFGCHRSQAMMTVPRSSWCKLGVTKVAGSWRTNWLELVGTQMI